MDDFDIYINSDEDEVFFGEISDKEKVKSYNLAKDLVLFSGESVENSPVIVFRRSFSEKSINNSFDKEDFYSINSSDASADMESNNTCMKQIIDKNILATPKSIVTADRDGGFLKVLSEIALVKAETDKLDEIMHEEKENKYIIPKIEIIEATPEKQSKVSPSQFVNTQPRRFRINYNLPKHSDNTDFNPMAKYKSFTPESKNNVRNIQKKNEGLGVIPNVESLKEISKFEEKIEGNSLFSSVDVFNESSTNDAKLKKGFIDDVENEKGKNRVADKGEENILEIEILDERNGLADGDGSLIMESEKLYLSENKIVKSSEMKIINDEIDKVGSTFSGVLDCEKNDLLCDTKGKNELNSVADESKVITQEKEEKIDSFKVKKMIDVVEAALLENLSNMKALEIDSKEPEPLSEAKSNHGQFHEETNFPLSRKFSEEARKIVDALRTSVTDDSPNFTIPEINLEEMENSFISPSHVSNLDVTVMDKKIVLDSDSKSSAINFPTSKAMSEFKIVETNRKEGKFFSSERKVELTKFTIHQKLVPAKVGNQSKKCVKKLPFSKKTPLSVKNARHVGQVSVEKKSKPVSSSKIPISTSKTLKLPSQDIKSSAKRTIQFKTPSGKIIKNSKFKNVESPIGAYIHNKPTTLIAHVKPDVKKNGLLNVQKNPSMKESSTSENTRRKEVALPFVEYQSGTPYKLDKNPDSRLPRLGPNVQKIIGSNWPVILKHEGKFFVKSPVVKKDANINDTIQSDSNEVSVLISKIAQKTNKR